METGVPWRRRVRLRFPSRMSGAVSVNVCLEAGDVITTASWAVNGAFRRFNEINLSGHLVSATYSKAIAPQWNVAGRFQPARSDPFQRQLQSQLEVLEAVGKG